MIDGLLFPPSILPIMPHRCDVVESRITTVSRLPKRRTITLAESGIGAKTRLLSSSSHGEEQCFPNLDLLGRGAFMRLQSRKIECKIECITDLWIYFLFWVSSSKKFGKPRRTVIHWGCLHGLLVQKKLLDNSYANRKVFFVCACVCVLMCMCLCVFRAPVCTAATSTRLNVQMALLKW